MTAGKKVGWRLPAAWKPPRAPASARQSGQGAVLPVSVNTAPSAEACQCPAAWAQGHLLPSPRPHWSRGPLPRSDRTQLRDSRPSGQGRGKAGKLLSPRLTSLLPPPVFQGLHMGLSFCPHPRDPGNTGCTCMQAGIWVRGIGMGGSRVP